MPADSTSPSVPDLQRRVDELAAELRARKAERDEAMQRERALAEVLQAHANSSPLPEFPPRYSITILERVMRLCAAAFGYLMTYEGERFQVVAAQGLPAPFAEYLRNMWIQPRLDCYSMPPSVADRHMVKWPTCAKEMSMELARCAGLWLTSVGREQASLVALQKG